MTLAMVHIMAHANNKSEGGERGENVNGKGDEKRVKDISFSF